MTHHLLFFSGGLDAHRQRKKKAKEFDHNFEWRQENGKSYQQRLRGQNQMKNPERRLSKSTIITSCSQTPSSVTITRINQREKSLNGNQRNVSSKQPYTKSTDGVRQDTATQSNLSNEVPLKNYTRTLTPLQNSFISTATKRETTTVPKRLQACKSSVEPNQSRSATVSKALPTKSSRINSNSSGKTRVTPRRASSVTVTRVRRSSSVCQNSRTKQQITTNLSDNNLNRDAVTILK
jgi:hypothetical protein